MNLDKYGKTNIDTCDFHHIDRLTYRKNSVYTRFIGHLHCDAKVLEVGPGNGSFVYFLKNYYSLDVKNIFTVDISKSVVELLDNNLITKSFHNNCEDTINFLAKHQGVFDLIVMKHVIEHMPKEYIIQLIPILIGALSPKGKILIETPNLGNIPFGLSLYNRDFSHYTGFTEKSMKEAFIRNSDEDLSIEFHNLYLTLVNYKNPFTIITSFFANVFYRLYVSLLLLFYRAGGLSFIVGTTGLICIVTKKNV